MSKYARSSCPHHFFIQNKLILAINDPAFELVLELMQSTWNRVLLPDSDDDDERDRLEFLGDALSLWAYDDLFVRDSPLQAFVLADKIKPFRHTTYAKNRQTAGSKENWTYTLVSN
jgi:hypothetical protein